MKNYFTKNPGKINHALEKPRDRNGQRGNKVQKLCYTRTIEEFPLCNRFDWLNYSRLICFRVTNLVRLFGLIEKSDMLHRMRQLTGMVVWIDRKIGHVTSNAVFNWYYRLASGIFPWDSH